LTLELNLELEKDLENPKRFLDPFSSPGPHSFFLLPERSPLGRLGPFFPWPSFPPTLAKSAAKPAQLLCSAHVEAASLLLAITAS
jgi:hypothetical protein